MRRAVVILVVVSCVGLLLGLREVALTRHLVSFVRDMEQIAHDLQEQGSSQEVVNAITELFRSRELPDEVRESLNEAINKLPADEHAAMHGVLLAAAVLSKNTADLQQRASSTISLGLLGIIFAGGLLLVSWKRSSAAVSLTPMELLLTDAVKSAGHGVLICDVKGTAKWVNEAWCSLTGAGREQIVGRPLGDVASHLGLDAGELEEGLQATHPLEIEAKVQRGNEQLWAGLHLSPIRHNDQLTHFALTLRNITEEKVQGAENLLLARTLQSSDVGFLILDRARKVVWANESWCTLTNLDRPYIIGQSFQVVCRALDFDSRLIKPGADGTESVVVESSTTIEGSPRAYRWRVSPVRIAEGEMAYAVSLWRTDEEVVTG